MSSATSPIQRPSNARCFFCVGLNPLPMPRLYPRRIRLHDLRYSHATLALQAGVHPKVVQERLGHANIGITLDTYSHVTPAMQADAAERVAALLELSDSG